MTDSAPSNMVQAATGVKPPPWLKTNIAPILAIITVVLGFAYLFIGPTEDRAAVIALMMLGPTFYFGSSPGSRKKDDTIANLTSKGEAP
jgi:hypothetical protein